MSAAGPEPVEAPPMQLRSLLKSEGGQAVSSTDQSPTHSPALPPMSKTPKRETHALRVPVGTIVPAVAMLHWSTPLSAEPGSGVPAEAPCHSALVRRRLPELRHACCA